METYSIHSGATIDSTSDSARNVFTACLAEFVGTFMFLFFAFAATQIANSAGSLSFPNPDLAALIFESLAFGVSLAVNVWLFYRISGGMFNPAVSFALSLVGVISIFRAMLVVIFQLVAGISAAGIVSALFPGPLRVSTRLGGRTSIAQGLFIEMFLTALLVFAYIMLSVLKHRATFLAPLGIGLAMFISGLAGIYFTGASLNPARSLGPDTIIKSFPGYHWIYWLGPVLGALLALGFFWILRALGYETCNPEQDYDGLRHEPDNRSV